MNIYIINFLGTVYHNHKHGCQKCTIDGIYINRRMTFPFTDCQLRTDRSFRKRREPEHHRNNSIIEDLPIDMIKDFVTSDSLHLLDLGVMKRLINTWKDGTETYRSKWNTYENNFFDTLLNRCNKEMPREIHRRHRSITKMSFWKGTEFRTILLYNGIVLFKNMVTLEVYEHFLILFSAVTICTSDHYKHLLPLAERLFEEFVEKYSEIYGNGSVVSNIHNICHVVDDVRRFGDLTSISTYPFENKLRLIKLKLKQCRKALEQVSRRIIEGENICNVAVNLDNKDKRSHMQLRYPFEVHNLVRYEEVYVSDELSLSSRKVGDMWFMTTDRIIARFVYAEEVDGLVKIRGSSLRDQTSFFTKPFMSSSINVFKSNGETYHSNISSTRENLLCKMVCFTYEVDSVRYKVYLPLLHTLH